jgi:GTP-binding protein
MSAKHLFPAAFIINCQFFAPCPRFFCPRFFSFLVIMKCINDELCEPFETLYVDVLDEYLGGVMKTIAERKGKIEDMNAESGRTSLQAYVPTRGLIGFEFELMNLTSGHGIHSHLFREYAPQAGTMQNRTTGTLVSTEAGEATSYALDTIQVRGKLFIAPGDQVYDGMLVGAPPVRTTSRSIPPAASSSRTSAVLATTRTPSSPRRFASA